jgi:hypothetical protein
MIYRFKQPIKLSDGTILKDECFFDSVEDNEIQNKVREQVAKEQEQAEAMIEKIAKKKK